MSDSQASQFMREKFPPQNQITPQSSKRLPQDDSEMMTYYMTCAKNSMNSEQIIKMLSLIEHSVTFNQNLKNLAKANKEELKKALVLTLLVTMKINLIYCPGHYEYLWNIKLFQYFFLNIDDISKYIVIEIFWYGYVVL